MKPGSPTAAGGIPIRASAQQQWSHAFSHPLILGCELRPVVMGTNFGPTNSTDVIACAPGRHGGQPACHRKIDGPFPFSVMRRIATRPTEAVCLIPLGFILRSRVAVVLGFLMCVEDDRYTRSRANVRVENTCARSHGFPHGCLLLPTRIDHARSTTTKKPTTNKTSCQGDGRG